MRRRILFCLSLTLLLGCASSTVSLDRVEGVYATHFDGIPDRSRVCAVLTNRGTEPVQWVRLRLLSYADAGARRQVSHWVAREPLAPGESAAVELIDPPVAREAELSVQSAGRAANAPFGRTARRSPACSEAELLATAHAESSQRTADGIEIVPLAWRGSGERDALAAAD